MKDIKQKPGIEKNIKAIDKSAVATKKMKDVLVKNKEKAENSYISDKNSPTEYAADMAQSSAMHVTRETINTAQKIGEWGVKQTYNNISNGIDKFQDVKTKESIKPNSNIDSSTNTVRRNAAQSAKQQYKNKRAKENITENNKVHFKKSANKTTIKNRGKQNVENIKIQGQKTIKFRGKGAIKTSKASIKITKASAKNTVKTAKATAKTAKATADATVKIAKMSLHTAKVATKASVVAVKTTIKGIATAVRAAVVALKGLVALIAAGGWIAVVVVLIICLFGLVVGSGFGIFYSNEPYNEDAIKINDVIVDLNTEFYDKIDEIETDVNADVVNIVATDGVTSIKWDEVLTIFSVKTTTNQENGNYVSQIDEEKKNLLRDILNDMSKITYTVETIEKEVEITDDEGEITTEIITETILEITITHKSYAVIMNEYGFNQRQKIQVEEMLDEENKALWATLIGGYISSSGQIIISGADVIPIDRFAYPLPYTYEITSYFGYREDPFTSEIAYHSGIDIAAPERTPILASESGVVAVANSTDVWGGGYGYYVLVEHGDGYSTFYAHCIGIAVVAGQEVQKGEVIGYVGTTGRSTGNHLHFEVRKNGEHTDPLSYFTQ